MMRTILPIVYDIVFHIERKINYFNLFFYLKRQAFEQTFTIWSPPDIFSAIFLSGASRRIQRAGCFFM
jgi:hypothetical protein